ncbi:LPS-assembly protein LptD [Caulobacter sp. HMWF025]|uniref:LPS-assembly protein LptD n=3 Tax=unclassified Caulobacter TaxID=2648921 RepID=UPI001E536AA7|nr:LPS-assembly protein LptD [Caulobacter sp. HMWF025]
MKDQRQGASPEGRMRLLGSVAGLVLAATAAHAQSLAGVPPVPKVAPAPDDGLGMDGYYLESDLLIRDDKSEVLTARGDVEVRYQGRTLRAEEVVYDTKSGVITAKGKVALINADGTAQFADELTLDKDLRAGFALGFSARMDENVKIAAATAIRRNETIQELNQAIYTPCEVCAEKPTPTWSLSADKVVQDKERQLVYYKKAVIRLWGAPLMYLPVFWHPDPQATRSSGFLTPKLGASKRRGMSYQQPYLQVISPSQDIVLSPQINTSVNPFLNVNWRKRFYSGTTEVRAGFTYEKDIDSKGERFGEATARSYILAKGKFDINDRWTWGFSAERTSDKLIFDNYDINDVYQQRGLFTSEDRRLSSQIYATRQDARSFLSVSAVTVQGLRVSAVDPVTGLSSFENSDVFPLIGPLVEGRWQPETPILGGRLRLQGSGVILTRTESPYAAGTDGVDSQRGSVNLDWRSNLTLRSGVRVSPFAQARGDAYRISDLPGADKTRSYSRTLGVTGVDLSWPLLKPLKGGTIVLEPMAQFAAGSDSRRVPVTVGTAGSKTYLYNEDSTSFEFDETNLFRANKSPGFDLYEGGQRMNVGGRATVTYDDGRGASVLVGRSFRSEVDPLLPARSGLQTKSSDWIVAATVTPIRGVNAFVRTRYAPDLNDDKLRRIEAGLDANSKYILGSARYVRDNQDANGAPLETFEMRGQLNLTKKWGLTAYGQRDLEAGVWRRRDLGVAYTDDCIRIDVIYQNEDRYSQASSGGLKLQADESIVLRLTLATLGDTGYSD